MNLNTPTHAAAPAVVTPDSTPPPVNQSSLPPLPPILDALNNQTINNNGSLPQFLEAASQYMGQSTIGHSMFFNGRLVVLDGFSDSSDSESSEDEYENPASQLNTPL